MYLLMVIATIASLGGIVLAWLVYQRRRIKAVEPKVLEEAWYYDRTVTEFMGSPVRRPQKAPPGSMPTSSTGRSRAPPSPCATAGELRKSQGGFVHAYAALIGVSVVLLAWFVIASIL